MTHMNFPVWRPRRRPHNLTVWPPPLRVATLFLATLGVVMTQESK